MLLARCCSCKWEKAAGVCDVAGRRMWEASGFHLALWAKWLQVMPVQ